MSFRKPRSDSRLANLPDDQRIDLNEWLLGGLSYERVKGLLKKEHKISTSISALSAYYDGHVIPLRLQQRSRAVAAAQSLATEAEKSPTPWDAALLDRLKEMALVIMDRPGAKASDVANLVGLFLQSRQQDLKQQDIKLKERRLVLLEKQATKAKETLGDGKLSKEEKLAKINEIFGRVA